MDPDNAEIIAKVASRSARSTHHLLIALIASLIDSGALSAEVFAEKLNDMERTIRSVSPEDAWDELEMRVTISLIDQIRDLVSGGEKTSP
ncbi:hypothetical protein [Ruegeria sp.]|uniref:hypothetical protein n=1 Tax=Ruegeria sp. TaxID=1879320 RepID=UPI003AFF66E8